MHFFMYQSAPSIVFEKLIFSKNHENKADNARGWLEMNAEENFDQFGTHMNPPVPVHAPIRWLRTNRKSSADHHVTDHFRKKSLFFRDTR